MKVTREEALRIAQADAEVAYGDLSAYAVSAEQVGETWRITYRPSDPYTVGGGPNYVISGDTAQILEKVYEQ